MTPNPDKKPGLAGVAIPAGLFIGLGVGFLIDNVVAGTFIGLGSGFFVMLLLRLFPGDR